MMVVTPVTMMSSTLVEAGGSGLDAGPESYESSFSTTYTIPASSPAETSVTEGSASTSGTGNTIYVSSSGNDSTGNGTSSNPYATFTKAISVVGEGDTIALQSDITLSSTLSVNKSVTISGSKEDGSGYSLIRGSASGAMLDVSADVTLDNVVIDGNKVTATGPSILKTGTGTILTLNNCTLQNAVNSYDFGTAGVLSSMGGAVNVMAGTVSSTNSDFKNNQTTSGNGGGAAIYLGGGADTACTVTLTGGTVSGNISASSAVFATNFNQNGGNGSMTLDGVDVTGNKCSQGVANGTMNFTLEGAVKITGNTKTDVTTVANLIVGRYSIIGGSLTSGAEIHVNNTDNNGSELKIDAVIGTKFDTGEEAYFTLDGGNGTKKFTVDGESLKLVASNKILIWTTNMPTTTNGGPNNQGWGKGTFDNVVSMFGTVVSGVTVDSLYNQAFPKDLADYSLIWLHMPCITTEDYKTNVDVEALKAYLEEGGRVVIQTETAEMMGAYNPGISALAQDLGGGFTIATSDVDAGVSAGSPSVNGDAALLKGVTVGDMNTGGNLYYPTITLSGSAEWIAKKGDCAYIADQAAGNGRITVMSDFNWYSNGTYLHNSTTYPGAGQIFKAFYDNSIENMDAVASGGDPNAGFGTVTVTTEQELNNAISNAQSGDIITLGGDITLTSGLTIDKQITINGNGHTIKRGSSFTGTLFTVNSGGNLTLIDVTVDGGAVWTANGSTEVITTGVTPAIINNTQEGGIVAAATEDGGGQLIFVNGGIFNLGANSVLQNNDRRPGGTDGSYAPISDEGSAVYINSGNFTMDKTAVIKNNRVADSSKSVNNGDGAAISMEAGEATITGTISGNYAPRMGGAIRIFYTECDVSFTDGAVIQNNYSTAGQYGAVCLGADVTVSGKVIIDGNYYDADNTNEANVHLYSGKINKGSSVELSVGSSIGIVHDVAGTVIGTGYGEGDEDCFSVDSGGLTVIYDDGTLKLGTITTIEVGDEEGLETAISSATPGTIIKLTGDITSTSPITIPADKNIILDLNGHSITNTEGAIVNNGTLEIINTSDTAGSVTGGTIGISNYGVLDIEGDSSTDIVISGGTHESISNLKDDTGPATELTVDNATIKGESAICDTAQGSTNVIGGNTVLEATGGWILTGYWEESDKVYGAAAGSYTINPGVQMKNTKENQWIKTNNGAASTSTNTGSNVAVSNWDMITIISSGSDGAFTAEVTDGSTEVNDLAALNAAIGAGKSPIKLGADITTTETIVIPAGKNIALDLNGHKLENTNTGTDQAGIINYGTLKVINSSDDPGTVKGRFGIINYGDLTVNGDDRTDIIIEGTIQEGICNNKDNDDSKTKLTIDGATVKGSAAIIDYSEGTTDNSIKEAHLESTNYGEHYTVSGYGTAVGGTYTIADGVTFKNNGKNNALLFRTDESQNGATGSGMIGVKDRDKMSFTKDGNNVWTVRVAESDENSDIKKQINSAGFAAQVEIQGLGMTENLEDRFVALVDAAMNKALDAVDAATTQDEKDAVVSSFEENISGILEQAREVIGHSIDFGKYENNGFPNIDINPPGSGVTDDMTIRTVTVSVDNGSIDGINITGARLMWDLNRSSLIIIYEDGKNASDVEKDLQKLKFTRTDDSKEQNIEVTVDDFVTNLGSNLSNVTITPYNGHYYMYVPVKMDWFTAHEAASGMTFMGMKGYLVTITTEDENKVLQNISIAGAWSGATSILYNGQKVTTDELVGSASNGGYTFPDNSGGYASKFYWSCGPEAGQSIPTGSWVWCSGEPNNSGGKEGFAQTNFTNEYKWNDLAYNGDVSGYFVEFGGISSSDPGMILSNGTYSLGKTTDVAIEGSGLADSAEPVTSTVGQEFTTTIEAESGWTLPSGITVYCNGVPIDSKDYTYDPSTGMVTVKADAVSGEISIAAQPTLDWYDGKDGTENTEGVKESLHSILNRDTDMISKSDADTISSLLTGWNSLSDKQKAHVAQMEGLKVDEITTKLNNAKTAVDNDKAEDELASSFITKCRLSESPATVTSDNYDDIIAAKADWDALSDDVKSKIEEKLGCSYEDLLAEARDLNDAAEAFILEHLTEEDGTLTNDATVDNHRRILGSEVDWKSLDDSVKEIVESKMGSDGTSLDVDGLINNAKELKRLEDAKAEAKATAAKKAFEAISEILELKMTENLKDRFAGLVDAAKTEALNAIDAADSMDGVNAAFAALETELEALLNQANAIVGSQIVYGAQSNENEFQSLDINPDTTKLADTAIVKTVTVSVDNGSIGVPTITDATLIWNIDKTSLIIIYTDGKQVSEVEKDLQGLVFNRAYSSIEQNIEITVDNFTTDPGTASSDVKITTYNGHYYMYVPVKMDWFDAYEAASGMTFMGMTGYLATVTTAEENEVLRNISTAGAWSGATSALYNGQKITTLDSVESASSGGFTIPSATGGYASKFYWACGPEAGQRIPTGEWVWCNGEPNRAYGTEGFAQVNYTTAYKWNDLSRNGNVSGYFVEFGGLTATGATGEILASGACHLGGISDILLNDVPGIGFADGSKTHTDGNAFNTTLEAEDGWILPATVTVLVNGVPTEGFTYDPKTGKISSGDAITGRVSIIAEPVPTWYVQNGKTLDAMLQKDVDSLKGTDLPTLVALSNGFSGLDDDQRQYIAQKVGLTADAIDAALEDMISVLMPEVVDVPADDTIKGIDGSDVSEKLAERLHAQVESAENDVRIALESAKTADDVKNAISEYEEKLKDILDIAKGTDLKKIDYKGYDKKDGAVTFPNLDVVTTEDVTTISIFVDSGSIDIDESKITNGKVLWNLDRTNAIIIFEDAVTASAAQEILQSVEFKPKDNTDQTIQITLDNYETKLGADLKGVNITSYDGHYYMYVPVKTDWFSAYKAASEMTLMGMKGYLATITSSAENAVLQNISRAGAWSGATSILYGGQKVVTYDLVVKASAGGYSFPNTYGGYASKFYWASGPEAGQSIPAGSWVWCNGEPNKYGGYEGFAQTNYTTSYKWNDLPYNGNVSGYFVEFGGVFDDNTESSILADGTYRYDPKLDILKEAFHEMADVSKNSDGTYSVIPIGDIDGTVTLPETLAGLDITVDLDGHTITGVDASGNENDGPGIVVAGNGIDLTIVGPGTVEGAAGKAGIEFTAAVGTLEVTSGAIVKGGDAEADGGAGGAGVSGASAVTVTDGASIIGGKGADGTAPGSGGAAILDVPKITLSEATVVGGDGGSVIPADTIGADGGAGGAGIGFSDSYTGVGLTLDSTDSTIKGGNGGTGGISEEGATADDMTGVGGDGGMGIDLNSGSTNSIKLNGTTVAGGDGGDGATPSNEGQMGAGGAGGAAFPSNVIIDGKDNTILGGNGGNGYNGGAGGKANVNTDGGTDGVPGGSQKIIDALTEAFGTTTVEAGDENPEGENNAVVTYNEKTGQYEVSLKNDVPAPVELNGVITGVDVVLNLNGKAIDGTGSEDIEAGPGLTVSGSNVNLTVVGSGSIAGGAGQAGISGGDASQNNKITVTNGALIEGGDSVTGDGGAGISGFTDVTVDASRVSGGSVTGGTGTGGAGIDSANATVSDAMVTGGSAEKSDGGIGGTGIKATGDFEATDSTITGGNGGNKSSDTAAVNAGAGGNGVSAGGNITVSGSTITAGHGGDVVKGASGSSGGNGGIGIDSTGTGKKVEIKDGSVASGGNGGDGNGDTGSAGEGGKALSDSIFSNTYPDSTITNGTAGNASPCPMSWLISSVERTRWMSRRRTASTSSL